MPRLCHVATLPITVMQNFTLCIRSLYFPCPLPHNMNENGISHAMFVLEQDDEQFMETTVGELAWECPKLSLDGLTLNKQPTRGNHSTPRPWRRERTMHTPVGQQGRTSFEATSEEHQDIMLSISKFSNVA